MPERPECRAVWSCSASSLFYKWFSPGILGRGFSWCPRGFRTVPLRDDWPQGAGTARKRVKPERTPGGDPNIAKWKKCKRCLWELRGLLTCWSCIWEEMTYPWCLRCSIRADWPPCWRPSPHLAALACKTLVSCSYLIAATASLLLTGWCLFSSTIGNHEKMRTYK